jgi:hypothetical protein
LPDGLLSYQKSKFGYIFEGLWMENVGIFYDLLSSLRLFLIFYGHLVEFVVLSYIFHVLVCLDQKKSGNPVLNGVIVINTNTCVPRRRRQRPWSCQQRFINFLSNQGDQGPILWF